MSDNKIDSVFRSSWYDYGNHMIKGSGDFEKCTNSNSSSGESMVSNGSLSESDDASSSGSFSFSSNNSNGSLYDLSEIMAQLPIKRGLSKFYQGKSESFTSLSRVTSIEELAKKTPPFRKKPLKASKSCGNGLNRYKPYTLPNSITTKKSMTGS